jgi:hypothetical protein
MYVSVKDLAFARAMLCKDHQFQALSMCIKHLCMVLKQIVQLFPLAVSAATTYLLCQFLQASQDLYLGFQFRDGACGRSLIDNTLFGLLKFCLGSIVEIIKLISPEQGEV